MRNKNVLGSLIASLMSDSDEEDSWEPILKSFQDAARANAIFNAKSWGVAVGVRLVNGREMTLPARLKRAEIPADITGTEGYLWFDISAAPKILELVSAQASLDYARDILPDSVVKEAVIQMHSSPVDSTTAAVLSAMTVLAGVVGGSTSESLGKGPAHLPILAWMEDVDINDGVDPDGNFRGHASEHGFPVLLVDPARSQGVFFACRHNASKWFGRENT